MNPPTPIRNFPNLDYHLTDFLKSRYNVGSSIQTVEEDSLGLLGFPGGLVVKNPPAVQETQNQSLSQEDILEESMATHYSILAWRIPWTEEPGQLWSMGLQGVGHDEEIKQQRVPDLKLASVSSNSSRAWDQKLLSCL